MPAETIAQWTLAAYALALSGCVVWRATRCRWGWRLWLLYTIDSLYCRLAFRWRSNGPCPFVDEPRAIVISNHRSPLDPLLVWVGVRNGRPLEYMTAREYFGRPGLQFIFDATRAIPVARDGKDATATRLALRRLEEGSLLGVFPEGRINTGSGLLPANPGIAWLAIRSRAPVYPVFIHGAPQAPTMAGCFVRFRRVRVVYGPAIDLAAWHGKRLAPEDLQACTREMMDQLARLGT